MAVGHTHLLVGRVLALFQVLLNSDNVHWFLHDARGKAQMDTNALSYHTAMYTAPNWYRSRTNVAM